MRHALIAASLLLTTGCTTVYTMDDVVTESAAVREDRIIGEWREIDGGDRARVVRGRGNDYAVSYMDKEDSVEFRARLGRLGSTMVIDAFPDTAQWRSRKEWGVPIHVVFAIEFHGDSLGLRGLKGDSVKKILSKGRNRVPYTENFGDITLHGDPAVVRAALTDVFQRRGVSEEVVWYLRTR